MPLFSCEGARPAAAGDGPSGYTPEPQQPQPRSGQCDERAEAGEHGAVTSVLFALDRQARVWRLVDLLGATTVHCA